MKKIKNIIIGVFIGLIFGVFMGMIFGWKVAKKSTWVERQKIQMIIFGTVGAVGGALIGGTWDNEFK